MNADNARNILLIVTLARELMASAQQLLSMPGFGTADGISKADLAALRLQEPVAQARLQAVIDAMPDDPQPAAPI